MDGGQDITDSQLYQHLTMTIRDIGSELIPGWPLKPHPFSHTQIYSQVLNVFFCSWPKQRIKKLAILTVGGDNKLHNES